MILAPFKWIVALFFNWSLALFHDPGWAVVGMSVLLSLLLTPLYIWIERRKNSDKAKSAPMQAEIDKIEAVYSGRERFYYTREIQRRYHYSPWTAVIPTLGLLVQIPFLLAAYHYLSELPVFNGAAFWYIKDLSKPDTIATFAGLPINLLAILMTVINLVSGWRYAESGKPKERIQYMAVAAIFLVLLYNCAASVVLYWTLSNALSLVRSEVFFRKKGIRSKQSFAFSADKVIAIARWACIYFLATAVILAVDAELMRISVPDNWALTTTRLYFVVTLLLLVTGFVAASVVIWRRINGSRLPYAYNFILVCIATAIAVPALHNFASFPVDESPIVKYISDLGMSLAAIMTVPLVAMSWKLAFGGRLTISHAEDCRYCIWIGVLATLGITFQLFLCGPVCAYASCPEGAGDATLSSLTGDGILKMIICVLIAWCALKFLPAKVSRACTIAILLLFVLFFINGNLVSHDYGVLFQGRYSNATNINPRAEELIFEAFALAFMVFIVGALSRLINRRVRIIVSVIIVIVASFVFRIGVAIAKMPRVDNSVSTTEADKKLFRFSRNAKNVVFLLLDAYVGQRFGKILDENPRLKEEFDGFTYYPNTISASTYTFPNMPAIWGGEQYFPWRIDKTRKLEATYREAWDSFETKIHKSGYRMATSLISDGYRGRISGAERTWQEMCYRSFKSRTKSNEGRINAASLKGNALMWAIPLAMRPYIYDSGRWHEEGDPFDAPFNFLEDLVGNSEIVDDPKGVFIKIHSETTHIPHLTRVDGVNKQLGVDSCFRWATEQVAKWLQWMKQEGIYDNTRIILCSDHGSPMNDAKAPHHLDPRYVKNVDKMQEAAGHTPQDDVHYYFALLATKDFSSRGKLKVDIETKTVSHGAYFAFGDPRFSVPVQEIVSSYVSCPPDWRERNGFVVLRSFRITGNASDGNNWKKIEK